MFVLNLRASEITRHFTSFRTKIKNAEYKSLGLPNNRHSAKRTQSHDFTFRPVMVDLFDLVVSNLD